MGQCSGSAAFRVSEGAGRRRRALLMLLVALVTMAQPAEAGPASRSPVSAHPRDLAASREPLPALRYREALGHAVVVPVLLDGRGPFDLVLDTATRFTTLDPELAAELGLEPLGQLPVATVAGVRGATRARLRTLRFGPIDLDGVDVLCAEVPVLRTADRTIRGFLGQSALDRMSFGLDHARRLIFFGPPPRADEALPLETREGRPVLRFTPKRSLAPLSLVLDSGVASPVLFRKPGSPLPLEPAPGYFEVKTSSGAGRLPMAWLEGKVGGLAVKAMAAAVQDDAAAGGREEDGLLPTRAFRSVYFDRTEGRLLINAR